MLRNIREKSFFCRGIYHNSSDQYRQITALDRAGEDTVIRLMPGDQSRSENVIAEGEE